MPNNRSDRLNSTAWPSPTADGDDDARELFRDAVADATPLPPLDRVLHETPKPPPIPAQREADERNALHESLHGSIGLEDWLESGDEAHFTRAGVPRQTLRDLKRGRWVIEAEFDLHGLTRDEARTALVEFLEKCRKREHRVLRVVHGRGHGSPGREGVLKPLVRGWLSQRSEVLAWCQAKPHDGGEGAVIVLLKAARTSLR